MSRDCDRRLRGTSCTSNKVFQATTRQRRTSWRCCRRWWRWWKDPDSDWDIRRRREFVICRKCLKVKRIRKFNWVFRSQRAQMMISHVVVRRRRTINWFSRTWKRLHRYAACDTLFFHTVIILHSKSNHCGFLPLFFFFVGTDFLSMTETLKFSAVLSTLDGQSVPWKRSVKFAGLKISVNRQTKLERSSVVSINS